MGIIRVTSAQLKAQSDKLKSLNNNFKQQVTSLDSTEGNLNSMWEGQANTAFHSAFQKDKTQMDNFYNAIEKYVAALNTIAAKYEQAEAANLETTKTRNY